MSDSNGLYVVVLAGGISHERDVSLRSGRRVADALAEAGHRVVLRDPDAGLLPYLANERPDVVFPRDRSEQQEEHAAPQQELGRGPHRKLLPSTSPCVMKSSRNDGR